MRVAIVGCGQIADAHIQEARKIPGVDVAAVCDLSVHMAEQAALRFGIRGVYTRLEAMLQEVRPEVVHVTTPPASHLSVGRIVLEHGSHAYIEKPFTLNVAEAEELAEVAVRAGTLICVGHNLAFDPAFLRLKELYAQGKLGKVVHVDVAMGYDLAGSFGTAFMGDPTHWLHRLPGGLAQNNISHPLSMILEFLKDGMPVVDSRGLRWRKQRYGDIRDEFFDELRVSITGRQTTSHLLFSCRFRPVQLYAVAHGTERQAVAHLDARTLRVVAGAVLPGPFRKVEWAWRDAAQAVRETRRHIANLLRARLHYFEGMKELFSRFYLAIAAKGEVPIPMSEAIRVTAIMDEIFRKCKDGDREAEGGERTRDSRNRGCRVSR